MTRSDALAALAAARANPDTADWRAIALAFAAHMPKPRQPRSKPNPLPVWLACWIDWQQLVHGRDEAHATAEAIHRRWYLVGDRTPPNTVAMLDPAQDRAALRDECLRVPLPVIPDATPGWRIMDDAFVRLVATIVIPEWMTFRGTASFAKRA